MLDGVVSSYLHSAIPLLWRGVKLRLTGWCPRICTRQFPSCGGVTSTPLLQSGSRLPRHLRLTGSAIPLLWRGVKLRLTGWCPLLWRGVKLRLTGWCSSLVEGCQASLDGVVLSPPAEGCQAPLDGVVSSHLHLAIPLLRRGVKLRLTGWWPRICTWQFPSCGGVSSSA